MLYSQVLNAKKTVGVAKSTQKLNPTVPKGKGKYIMKLINGMEPERYLASLLLANSSYKGEKYYEKEDEYTEIIKENKHLLSDNNEDGPIDEEDAFIWKVSYGEYKLTEDGGIILDSTAASVFSVGELIKVVFEDEEYQSNIYRVVKVTDTQCVCEFVK